MAVLLLIVAAAAALHVAHRGRGMGAWEFAAAAALLVAALARERREGFADMSGVFDKLGSIPGAIQDTVTPAMDRLIADVSTAKKYGETLYPSMYGKDPYVLTDNKPDRDKFDAMVREYQSIDRMLLTLQNYDSSLYKKLTA
jgi:hypothetical protein